MTLDPDAPDYLRLEQACRDRALGDDLNASDEGQLLAAADALRSLRQQRDVARAEALREAADIVGSIQGFGAANGAMGADILRKMATELVARASQEPTR